MTDRLGKILALVRLHWPEARPFREEQMMIESVALNDETVVRAANKVGKDWTAALICLTFFLCPKLYFSDEYVAQVESSRGPGVPDHLVHTRKILTTSVKKEHLDVLWGEIGRFIATSQIPLLASKGGSLVVNSYEIRLAEESEVKRPINYMVGRVAQQEESMAGHHAAYSMFVVDEASSMLDEHYRQAQGWAKRMLLFGNPWPCRNAFYRAVKGGDILA